MLKKIKLKAPILVLDGLLIPIAWYAAFCLRFNLELVPAWQVMQHFSISAVILFGVQVLTYYYFRVYRAVWRFISLNDVLVLLKSISLTCLIVIPALYLLNQLHTLPRSIFPLYFICLTLCWSSVRVLRRLYAELLLQSPQDLDLKICNVLVVGAGRAGANLVRELLRHQDYNVLGFVDDDLKKQGLTIHGVKVLGLIGELTMLINRFKVDRIIIAIPSMQATAMRKVVNLCEQTRISFHILPSIRSLANGDVLVNNIRPLLIEDLLGRNEVELDISLIEPYICNKVVLISGAGGSIGSELCRQIIKFSPKHLILVDHSEYLLYKIEQELQDLLHAKLKLNFSKDMTIPTKITASLLSVTDRVGLEACFFNHQPHLVFHAAAYKHVPMLETQVRSALLNNVVGTWTIADIAAKYHVQKFVLISTDKAVNPSNVMGACKRMAEMICQNFNKHASTKFMTVRFGNVLGSAGSVVPKFYEQIKKGGPLTVTHPEMTRYFMTIPEASRLILQAMGFGNGGEIYVLDMGEPVNITYLAQQMIRLSNQDITIKYTGLRPGEKLFEELFYTDEVLLPTAHPQLYQARAKSYSDKNWEDDIENIKQACAENNALMMQSWIAKWVPEYQAEIKNANYLPLYADAIH